MRVSVEKHDPGLAKWEEWHRLGRIKVYLDGVEVKQAITADEETGEILRCVLTAEGKLQPASDFKSVWTEWVRGQVRIVVEDRQTGEALYDGREGR